MAAAARFFRGDGGGEGLPYLAEFLLCTDYGWSWQQLQATPAPVLAYWQFYRAVGIQVQAAKGPKDG